MVEQETVEPSNLSDAINIRVVDGCCHCTVGVLLQLRLQLQLQLAM
jgi:hypothetical protein